MRHLYLLLRPGIMLCALCFVCSSQAAPYDPHEHFFQDSFGDLQEEMEIVRSEAKKAILVMFEMDECPFCHRMKNTILNQPDVQNYYRKYFRIISVDIEGDVEMVNFKGKTIRQKEFAFKENKVRATPVFVFFDEHGKQIVRYTGATSTKEEFMWLGEFVVGGHYANQRFTQYKRMRRSQAIGR